MRLLYSAIYTGFFCHSATLVLDLKLVTPKKPSPITPKLGFQTRREMSRKNEK